MQTLWLLWGFLEKGLMELPEKNPTCKGSIGVKQFTDSVPRGLRQVCKILTYCNLMI